MNFIQKRDLTYTIWPENLKPRSGSFVPTYFSREKTTKGEKMGREELSDWDWHLYIIDFVRCSVAQLSPTFCNPKDCSMPGFPVLANRLLILCIKWGFPGDWVSIESACNAVDTGDTGLILGSRRSSAGGQSNSLQYSCLENPMDKGAVWQATVHRVAKSWTWLKDWADTHLK